MTPLLSFILGFGPGMLKGTLNAYPFDSKLLQFCRKYRDEDTDSTSTENEKAQRLEFDEAINGLSDIFDEQVLNYHWGGVGLFEKLNLLQLLLVDFNEMFDFLQNTSFWAPERIPWDSYPEYVKDRRIELNKYGIPLAIALPVSSAMKYLEVRGEDVKNNPFRNLGVFLANGYSGHPSLSPSIPLFYEEVVEHCVSLIPNHASKIKEKATILFSQKIPNMTKQLEMSVLDFQAFSPSFHSDFIFDPCFLENTPIVYAQWRMFNIIYQALSFDEKIATNAHIPKVKRKRGARKRYDEMDDQNMLDKWAQFKGRGRTREDFCETFGYTVEMFIAAQGRNRHRKNKKTKK